MVICSFEIITFFVILKDSILKYIQYVVYHANFTLGRPELCGVRVKIPFWGLPLKLNNVVKSTSCITSVGFLAVHGWGKTEYNQLSFPFKIMELSL